MLEIRVLLMLMGVVCVGTRYAMLILVPRYKGEPLITKTAAVKLLLSFTGAALLTAGAFNAPLVLCVVVGFVIGEVDLTVMRFIPQPSRLLK